jgi:Tfp pilus assembly protein FimT
VGRLENRHGGSVRNGVALQSEGLEFNLTEEIRLSFPAKSPVYSQIRQIFVEKDLARTVQKRGHPEVQLPRLGEDRRCGEVESEMIESSSTKRAASDEAGFSVIDILIVVAVLGVVTSFALVQTTRARKNLTRANEARKFAAYLEKSRLDSIRRRATATAQMGRITIINASSYSVLMDSDGDGAIDVNVVSMPIDSNVTFNAPFPRTIYFNWRGRTVDVDGNMTAPNAVTIRNTYGTNIINITGAGEASIDTTVTAAPVANSLSPSAVFRSQTTIP